MLFSLRKRKDKSVHINYHSIETLGEIYMEHSIVSPDILVAELFNKYPQTVPIFIGYQMSCVGCDMNGFETLEDAAKIYGIQVDQLIAALEKAILGSERLIK
jgi:hybrid cluster-associated redox disulfide protein